MQGRGEGEPRWGCRDSSTHGVSLYALCMVIFACIVSMSACIVYTYTYVCMYCVHLYICLHVLCTLVHMSACIVYTYTYVCMYGVHLYICLHVLCTLVHMSACIVYTCTYVCMSLECFPEFPFVHRQMLS